MMLKCDFEVLKSTAKKEYNSYWTMEHKTIIANEVIKIIRSKELITQSEMVKQIEKKCNEINAELPKKSRLEKYKLIKK